jgi:hypothetical protein
MISLWKEVMHSRSGHMFYPSYVSKKTHDRRRTGKCCQTHMTYTDQRVILAYVLIFLDFGAIHFRFHNRISHWPINFQSATPWTAQGDKRFCAFWRSVKLCPIRNKHPDRRKGLTFDCMHGQWTNTYKKNGVLIDVSFYLFYFLHT